MSNGYPDHFSRVSEDYLAHRPTYPRDLIEFLAGLAPRTELAWDCGCGSGQLSKPLVARFERVVATDASAEQIAQAVPHSRIEYRCAPADASGLEPSSVDLCVAAQAAHWFDLERYYGEVRRVGRHDGIVALVSYGVLAVNDVVDEVVLRFYRDILGPYWPPQRVHVEDGYRSLPFPFRELATPTFELQSLWALVDMIGYIRTWSAVRALERVAGPQPFQAFCRELTTVWGHEVARRQVRWPLSLRVGTLGGSREHR